MLSCSQRSTSAKKEAIGVPATLALAVEDSTFLVSQPDHTSGQRTVHFVLRCDGSTNVIAYQLPEVLQRNVLPSELQYVPVISSSSTKLSEEAGSKPGEYFTLEYKTIKEDVCSGKLLVIKHPDPHAIMTLCTQEAAWKLLLTSVGGRYAKLAAQDGQTSRHLQGPLLGLV